MIPVAEFNAEARDAGRSYGKHEAALYMQRLAKEKPVPASEIKKAPEIAPAPIGQPPPGMHATQCVICGITYYAKMPHALYCSARCKRMAEKVRWLKRSRQKKAGKYI